MITILRPGLIKLDYGPMQMTIQAERQGTPLTEIAQNGAKRAIEILQELADYRQIAALPQDKLEETASLPLVLQTMIAAVRQSGDVTLTPMAAVAGSIAGLVADFIAENGATKVIVNNGGDLAIRLLDNETTSVGIAPAIGAAYTHTIQLKAGDGVGGIATSGLGGRSFTKGIASAAVVAAATSGLADACATSLANSTYVPHPNIKMALAEQVDPDTDIAGHEIVTEVGPLPPEILQQALYAGWEKANAWYQNERITGAALFVGTLGVLVPENFAVPTEYVQIEEGFRWKFAN
ncbi:MAG: hypothetical protein H6Q65_480 [Firmicutes bacterium]|nr:hypothetical protein [Bacillota bacterium]